MDNRTVSKLTKNMTSIDRIIFKAKRNKFITGQEKRELALYADDKAKQCTAQATLIRELRSEIEELNYQLDKANDYIELYHYQQSVGANNEHL